MNKPTVEADELSEEEISAVFRRVMADVTEQACNAPGSTENST